MLPDSRTSGSGTCASPSPRQASTVRGMMPSTDCACFWREGGMAIEALQAQAGHRSIASTRIYLHLGDGWLADEYKRAAEAIEAQATIGAAR